MEITEVRIKLVENNAERLRAFCSITLDSDFVIRDLKIIDGANGVFVAMPSRKLMDRCTRCGSKNHLRARFCNDCGNRLNENRAPRDAQGRAKLHADVAHPINAGCREQVQKAVVAAYETELEHAKSPDYRPMKYDDYEDTDFEEPGEPTSRPESRGTHSDNRDSKGSDRVEASEESPVEASSDEQFGDYNALIADLKRDAQGRREGGSADFNSSGPSATTSVDDPPREPQRDTSRRSRPEAGGSSSESGQRQDVRDDFGAGL